jgi:hypothetical protein
MTTHDPNPEMDYYANRALSHSRLKEIRKSPGNFKWRLDNETPSTDAMNLGSLVHAMLLEPHTVEGCFGVMPKFDKRTKVGKEDYKKFLSDNPMKVLVTEPEWAIADGMKDSVYAHPGAASLLNNVVAHGTAEKEYYWDDHRGISRKAKVDGIAIGPGERTIVDVKTTIDASPSGFRQSITKYCYGTQMAYYREAAASDGKELPSTAIIIAVAKTPPYGVGLYRFLPESLDKADLVVNNWIQLYQDCTDRGVWPSWWDMHDVDIPDWFLTQNGVQA